MSKNQGVDHPKTLVALSIVRTSAEFTARSRIRSVAMFTARLDAHGPTFAVDHFGYAPGALRAQIISDVTTSLPRSASLVAAAQPFPRGYLRRVFAGGEVPPPTDVQLIARARRDVSVLPLVIGKAAIAAAAADLGIPLVEDDARVVQRARRAADHAEAIWASFVLSLCSRRDRINLISAYRAWRVLRRARPLPF
ncbi:hypothetical protein [Qipengyuania sediminis]|uniref:hypothetical protein n=1 Tax=Qipengyuania sediminis TaxID=1532023 RepID=UPI00105A9949|nr:hypothetical protein [Qipengyuania sediminis]